MRVVVLVVAVGLFALAGPSRSERRAPPPSREVEAVSAATYGKLTRAQEALEAERYGAAETKLRALLRSGGLNDHEEALVQQTLGYAYSGQERHREALQAFRASLALAALPPAAQQNNRFNVGQLHLLLDEVDAGIGVLRSWFEQADNPGASAHMLLANAYAQKEDYASALPWVEQGLARMDPPRATWVRLGAQLNLAADEPARAAHWLSRAIALEPGRKSDWIQLASIHAQLGRNDRALAVLSVAARQGLVQSTVEREQLAQLYLLNGIPWTAARRLQADLDSGALEPDADTLRLLADAWSLAREDAQAVAPLTRAAQAGGDGRLWLRLGRIHLDAERWEEAQSSIERALARGGLDNPGDAQLLLGITFYERQRYDAARTAFTRALKDPKSRGSAGAWLQVIDARG